MSATRDLTREKISTLTQNEKRTYDLTKRLFDIILSTITLIMVLPLFPFIALAIKLDSKGHVFHKRLVVGKNGRAFYALKFRSMIENADNCIDDCPEIKDEYIDNVKAKNDPRVTNVGKFLRKSSLDELPQLLNVIMGDMSLVGPRIISFPELEKFGGWQDKLLEVKPGITGLWQVSGRSNLPYEERINLNIKYIENRNLLMDILILLRTILVVIIGEGAY